MLSRRLFKRIMIAIAGFTVLLIGVVMIITPGPAIIVIPAGLSILAIEFAWARRWLKHTREYVERTKKRMPPAPAWLKPWVDRVHRWKEKIHPTKTKAEPPPKIHLNIQS